MNTHCLKIALKTTIPVFLGYISCGIAFTIVTYLWKKNTLVSIFGGTIIYMILIRVM